MYEVIRGAENQFGIQGSGITIDNIFTSVGEANIFVYMLNRYHASPSHIYDIIEDYFGDFGVLCPFPQNA